MSVPDRDPPPWFIVPVALFGLALLVYGVWVLLLGHSRALTLGDQQLAILALLAGIVTLSTLLIFLVKRPPKSPS